MPNFSVDPDLVWDTVTVDLPPVVAAISEFLNRADSSLS